jgi:hypothetical protein
MQLGVKKCSFPQEDKENCKNLIDKKKRTTKLNSV